ncbi:MAG: glycosyltransferase family 2 protein [Cyclobacteriaceae bacterium]|nr:glycosyltransferase family 2 protein [Cyclobacteriaceae bacterium]
MAYPLISFITINFNSTKDTIEFLESAEKLTYPNYEIIVVDNASIHNPKESLTKKFPGIKFIRSDKNLGFAGGNNLGLTLANGDYFFFLNNDTILFPDFLEPIVNFMIEHPEAGMASPKVLYSDAVTIQYAGAISINFLGRGRRIGLHEKDNGQYNYVAETDLGHGAALIVPRAIVEKVGKMPELFFLYYEEHDWCEQVKRQGYKMYYLGNSKILHKESISTGGNESYLKVYYLNRNRFLFMRRNFKGVKRIIGLAFYTILAFPKNLIAYLLKGRVDLAGAILRGFYWNLKNPYR